jgi:hypothetical protein
MAGWLDGSFEAKINEQKNYVFRYRLNFAK